MCSVGPAQCLQPRSQLVKHGRHNVDEDPAADAASLCIWTSSITWILLLFSSSWFLSVKASSTSDKPRVATDIESRTH